MLDQKEDGAKTQAQLSFGQKAVGITFNPGGNQKVESIKQKFAEIIDELEGIRNPVNEERHPEVGRMISVAITEAQTSQMWAVKAVTWQY
jgi:hypothetical protein